MIFFYHIAIYIMEHIIRAPPTKEKKEHWVSSGVERGTRVIVTKSFTFNGRVGN